MHLPLRRIFDEKRRLVIPVARRAGAERRAVRRRRVSAAARACEATEARAAAAAQQLQAAERDDADARGITEGRDRTDTALKAFYKDVLPSSHAQARQATFLRLTQLAEQHNLEAVAAQHRSQAGEGLVARAPADFDDAAGQLRGHPPLHLSGRVRQRFHRHRQHLACSRATEAGAPLTLALALSTYYQAGPDGP